MTSRKQKAGARNFKSLPEWEELGFELRANETCFAVHSLKGAVFAEGQMKKKKKNNGRQQLQDSDNKT